MENNHLLRLYVLCFVMAMFCGCGKNNSADQKHTDIYPKIAFAGDSLLSALLGAPMPAYYIGMSRDSFDVLRLEDKNGTIDIGGRLFSYEGKFLRDSLRGLELTHQYRWYFKTNQKQDVWCDSALWYSVMNHLESIIGVADYYKLSKFYKKKTSRDTAYYAFWDFGPILMSVEGDSWYSDYMQKDSVGRYYMDDCMQIVIADTLLRRINDF